MRDRQLPPLPPDVAALLMAERRAPPPSAARQANILSRLETVVGIATGLTALSGATEASATPAIPTGAQTLATASAIKGAALVVPLSKSLLAAVAVAALGVGAGVGVGSYAYFAKRSHGASLDARHPASAAASPMGAASLAAAGETPAAPPDEPPPSVAPIAVAAIDPVPEPLPPSPTAPLVTPPAAVGASARLVAPAPVASAARGTARTVTGAAGHADMAAESALLEHARIALAEGLPAIALADVTTHARRFSRGLLVEEREALWIKALVGAGDGDGARARAVAFHRRFPNSIQSDTIARALQRAP